MADRPAPTSAIERLQQLRAQAAEVEAKPARRQAIRPVADLLNLAQRSYESFADELADIEAHVAELMRRYRTAYENSFKRAEQAESRARNALAAVDLGASRKIMPGMSKVGADLKFLLAAIGDSPRNAVPQVNGLPSTAQFADLVSRKSQAVSELIAALRDGKPEQVTDTDEDELLTAPPAPPALPTKGKKARVVMVATPGPGDSFKWLPRAEVGDEAF